MRVPVEPDNYLLEPSGDTGSDHRNCKSHVSGGSPRDLRWYVCVGTAGELEMGLPDGRTIFVESILGLRELEKNDLYLLGTTAGFRFGWASDMMFQSTGEA